MSRCHGPYSVAILTMKANPDSVFSLAARTANKVNSLNVEQEVVDDIIQNSNHPYWAAIEGIFRPTPAAETPTENVESARIVGGNDGIFKTLAQTGPVFADWLTAREQLHKFLTGETIKLQEMFEIRDAILIRNDIMPFFRPAGASNRDAVNWKKKLGVDVYEETDVMKYANAKGPKIPELGYIARSLRPDENTLGKKAKCPDDLIKVKMEKNQAWVNLFGYSDADNLHFLITEKHLDPDDTWTWFPEDRLPGGRVAGGYWSPGRVRSGFCWGGPQGCAPVLGARLAEFFPLKTS